MQHPSPADQVLFRSATRADVSAIIKMLAEDPISAQRETVSEPLLDSYYQAFEAIDRDPNNELIVAELNGRVVGVLQLTFIPNLTYRGGWRALVEGVHVSAAVRSQGIGKRLLQWAIDRARQKSCRLVQLTSDKRRTDAIRFYESLGFIASHEGMKLHLANP